MSVLKFGGGRERRPNPLVELHSGFTAANGDTVAPYVRSVKFSKKDGRNIATSFNVSITGLRDYIADLQAALERAESGEPIEGVSELTTPGPEDQE